jgi:ABC-type sugar transport system permease subunit
MKDARLGWTLALPAIGVVAAVAVVPIGWTLWESLHLHDLRMPWLGRPFIGLANYREALADARFRDSLAHTAAFAAVSVALELAAGLLVALALERVRRARGLVRTAVLLPWAIPTVVVALVWRFMFESPGGLVNGLLLRLHVVDTPPTWFADALAAWLPIVLADVWKTTPFVAILLLAGLQNIDASLYEAARVDGAGRWRTLFTITLPLLRPALLVAFLFRTLDAFRVFDLVYVMTGGGPGTATEPIAVYTFASLLQNLRFGYGAALSVVVFALALLIAVATILLFGRGTLMEERA